MKPEPANSIRIGGYLFRIIPWPYVYSNEPKWKAFAGADVWRGDSASAPDASLSAPLKIFSPELNCD